MPDIALRFHKDMLVLSSPISSALARQGVDTERDADLLTLVEPDSIAEVLRLEKAAGAQCLVAGTAGVAPARMVQVGLEGKAAELAAAALAVVREQTPQHVLAELGPCGLPLDASSKASLNENRDQYARAVRSLAAEEFDALFLNGFASCADLKCALMGARQVYDGPLMASVCVDASGTLRDGRETLADAVAIMADLGADVAGFSTPAPVSAAVSLAKSARAACELPLLVQLEVRERNQRQQGPTDENPYYCADTMVDAALTLRAAGVQFLRAVGAATPAYTGALAATVLGLDALPCAPAAEDAPAPAADPEALAALAADLRGKVAAALGE